ncbi:MAG: VirB4 family type IV secretion system protein, partial [Clostridium sp.]
MAKDINYNPYLIKKIQPVGGIKFDDRQVVKGDGYEACIHIYEFPVYVDDFWLENILGYEDVVATLDIATEERKVSLDKLNKSIREQTDRYYNINDNVDKINAAAESRNLTDLVEEITQADEVIKLVTLRLYVSAQTSKELDIRIKRIVERLSNDGFKGAVFLNEQEYEWKAMFKSAKEQSHDLTNRTGKQIASTPLGGGYPFHYSELADPTGIYIGTTRTGGNVLFDLFTRNEVRKSYNALVVGMMGSGKSTFLKKLLVNNAIVNNSIRVLDIAGEFKTLVTALGGKVVALDGSDGIINPLEIFATVIDETTNKVNEENSFMLHLSKVSMIYQFISPSSEQAEIREFEKVLSDFYTDYGIERSKASTYNSLQYPIMEELVEYAKKILYSDEEFTIVRDNLTLSRQERLEHIILNLDGIVRDYGALFNGHSSIENMDKEQIVSFEVKNLTQFDKRIFEAQTFNILTMLWNNALQQGIREKRMFESGVKS